MAIVARLEGRDKDGIGINVVGHNYLLVSTSGADGQPDHVIIVKLADWLYPDMEFLRLDRGELTGDTRKRVNGDWLQWRLPLCGPDTFTGLREVSFKGLSRDRAVFGGGGKGDSRPGSKVARMDVCKPHVLDRKS